MSLAVQVDFEVENLGSAPTSLRPEVKFLGWAEKGEPVTAEFRVVDGCERNLPPLVPRRIVDKGFASSLYAFSVFSAYRLRLTRGPDVTMRSFGANPRLPAGWLRFHWKRALFLWLGRVPAVAAQKDRQL